MFDASPESRSLRRWLYCLALHIMSLVAIPFAGLWTNEAERLMESNPQVVEARAAWWDRHEPGGFEKYIAARKQVGQRLSPSFETRKTVYYGTFVTALLLFVAEFVAFGFMLANRDIRANYRWYVGWFFGIVASLVVFVGLVFVSAITRNTDSPEVRQVKEENKNENDRKVADQRLRDAEAKERERIRPQVILWVSLVAAVVVFFFHAIFGETVCLYVLLYKLWEQVQDGEARAEPRHAIGLLFVPLYNLYWIFVAFAGLADELNRCARKRGIEVKAASRGLMVTYCVLCIVILVVPFAVFVAAPINLVIGPLAFRSATRVGNALKENW